GARDRQGESPVTGPTGGPAPARLRELLAGGLNREEENRLSGHLDTCVNCQQTLESLAAGGGTVPRPEAQPAHAESALQRAMRELKAAPSEAATIVGPTPRGDAGLDFLEPADNPQLLGRFGAYQARHVLGRGGIGL